ncbi:MAG TPA: TMEM175 family protein [Pseudonocardiaceae bacterium]
MPTWTVVGALVKTVRVTSEQPEPVQRPGVGSPRRLEALSDGAFAIVLTIIVIEIHVPAGPPSELVHQLGELVPTLLAYGLVFMSMGVIWFGNRTQTEFLERADHPYVWLNLLMLMLVAFVPFTAEFLARYPTTHVAVGIFGAHMFAIEAVHGAIWVYLTARPDLMRPGVTAEYRRRSRFPGVAPALAYAVATVVGLLWPVAGLVCYVLIPLAFISGLYYRWLGSLAGGTADQED